jgi:hypothetical protein
MTIEIVVETGASAKMRGFKYVRSNEIAVVSITGRRNDSDTPLRAVLHVCVERFATFLSLWLSYLSRHRLLLFAATPLSNHHNVVSRRRGVWGAGDFRWLPASSSRSPSVELVGSAGCVRFAGLTEVDRTKIFEAADFARTYGDSFILLSSTSLVTEECVRAIGTKVFPSGQSALDWASAVALVEEGQEVCIRASGNFDDRDASIDAFLSYELFQKIVV